MKRLWAGLLVLTFLTAAVPVLARDYKALSALDPPPTPRLRTLDLPPGTGSYRVLIAGDSWAQYLWDDRTHNYIFDRYGHADKLALSESRPNNDPPYTGTEYAVSGSEAREWIDTATFPWITNMVAALNANPTIDVVVLSIGGNDILAGQPGGGWYKDMDLDNPGSEAALFDTVEAHTLQIIDAIKAVRPDLEVMISSYDYPNFNALCFIVTVACDMREDLSRDPVNDLITDSEINALMVDVEDQRIGWAGSNDRVVFDNSVGLMHYFYGDGVSAPLVLPRPGTVPPLYLPFPGGNQNLPSLRSNFRNAWDPIHLDAEGYEYKIVQQTEAYFFPRFRGDATETFYSQGGAYDGWTDGTTTGTNGIVIGDNSSGLSYGIVSFDTSNLPDGAVVQDARFYLTRESATGTNPFAGAPLGIPTLDVVSGTFGAAAVEASDATATADFVGAGYLAGSASSNGHAVGVQLDASALPAINTQGLTQFRLYFPSTGGGAGSDAVTFSDGDATGIPGGFPTLAAYMGTSRPFLDVAYEVTVGIEDQDAIASLPRLLPNSPNPFTRSTSIRFLLAEPTHVRLDIYDIQGRRVATLEDRVLSKGSHAVTWDGRDAAGVRVSAGIYLAALGAGPESRTRKIVLAN